MLDSHLLPNYPLERVKAVRDGLEALSPREAEILKAIIGGETSEITAERLGIASRTVELHRQHILDRLKVRNIVEAIGLINEVERADTSR